ncbi:hypothetical protein LMG26788_02005 [Achromobacter pulmonis]|uniref:Uncharacterized protein n=1 Tax=Achromobacter pulmonis TaxID=1389932 RepID=A0A6S7DK64_9BURK|nr:hypothetical protein [Achromobacter pulmonis]CAB3855844.1 hypothetical protein LMG26788_02005 [Achromobacter pulmonis]
MDIALTYFLNRLSDDDLAALLRRRKDFYLENITAMDVLTTRMQALLAADGLSSVVQEPPRGGTLGDDLLPNVTTGIIALLHLLWMLLRLLARHPARRRRDVILRITSDAAMHVIFRPQAPEHRGMKAS